MQKNSKNKGANIAMSIKERRNELNLSIEEAAKRAGVGTQTWNRYENGAPIRSDKCQGVCKALDWKKLPSEDRSGKANIDDDDYGNVEHEAWSTFLADCFGDMAAKSFAIGSDILIDNIHDDLRELSKMPRYSHIGELDHSQVKNSLPQRFLMQYDYDFLYRFMHVIIDLRSRAKSGIEMYAHSVLEELAIYISVEEAEIYFELMRDEGEIVDKEWKNWVFDLFDDCDIITYLYDELYYIDESNIYHFSNWDKEQFYLDL